MFRLAAKSGNLTYLTWWGFSINEGGNNNIHIRWGNGIAGFYLCVMGKSLHWFGSYK